jgi:hypothetical protein
MFKVGLKLKYFSLHYAALEENLRLENYTPEQINQAKENLTEVIKGSKEITKEVQELYQKIFPKNRNKIILAIKQELKNFCVNTILDILADSPFKPKFEPSLEALHGIDSYIEDRLDALRRLGEAKITSWYFHHTYTSFQSNQARTSRAENIANSIIQEFSQGIPTSCASMAKIVRSRQFCYEPLVHIEPISDIDRSLEILKRLADLGDPTAQQELFKVVDFNTIGDNVNHKKINLSIEERIETLKKLAFDGHIPSQNMLANACIKNRIGFDNTTLSEAERKELIQKLLQIENTSSYHLLSIICDNKMGELPLGLSLERRFDMLYNRAKKGDSEAYKVLFHAYKNNRLCTDRLNLCDELRLTKLNELKEINPKKWQEYLVSIYVDHKNNDDHSVLFKPNLTNDELLFWLEDQAFAHGNSEAKEKLFKSYIKNELVDSSSHLVMKLDLPLSIRLEKLCNLADKGYLDAQYKLIDYWNSSADDFNIISRDKNEYIVVPSEVIFKHLLKWSLESPKSRQHVFLDQITDPIKKSIIGNLLKISNTIHCIGTNHWH